MTTARDRISIALGDITTLTVDVVVNAANETLCGGGGVDGAIHRAAGPALLAHCQTLGGAETGDVVLTPAFALPARFIAHAVGPIWRGGKRGEPELLARCYTQALALAEAARATSIAFPSISTGAYHYPIAEATRIACETVLGFLDGHDFPARVVFAVFSEADQRVYEETLAHLAPRGTFS